MRNATLANRSFERILLIKLSSIGDVVHTIPLLNALRRHYPAARIDWLSKPTPAEFIRDLPALNQVLVYGENQTEAPQYRWDGVTHFARLIRDRRFLAVLSRLRAARYDLVIDMQGQMKSGFVSMVTGAPVRIGFDRPRKEVWEAEAPQSAARRHEALVEGRSRGRVDGLHASCPASDAGDPRHRPLSSGWRFARFRAPRRRTSRSRSGPRPKSASTPFCGGHVGAMSRAAHRDDAGIAVGNQALAA